jgi:ABC-type Na+ efflux pump permease subunit
VSELGVVFVTELARKFRSTIFWLATLGGMVAIAFLVEAPVVLAGLARSSTSDIVLAGPKPLRDRAAALLQARKDFHVVAALDALPARVTPAYLEAHGNAGAAIAISVRNDRIHLDVYPKDLSAFDDVEFHSLAPLGIELATGLSSSRVESAGRIERTVHPLDAKFADTRAASLAHGITFGLIFILYLSIVISSQSIMSAVAEEKTNRIAEILIATIDPANLLYGKTLAAAVVAMAQIGLWVGTAGLLLPQVASSLSSSSPPPATRAGDVGAVLQVLDPGLLLAFAIFFVLGYLQYATIYAAAGSLVSRTEELGAVATPVILPVVGAFLVANFALLQPAAPIVVACSFIPFLSPFVIFTRVAISEVPAWQIALAVLVNIATVAACFWAAGGVYRVGMLLYGRLPSPRQIVAALRA